MPTKAVVPASVKPVGFLDLIGHSIIADATGVSQPDYGPAHLIDQLLQPAMYRSCAIGGAVHAWHQRGNGTLGDGGWASAATEFDRQEAVSGYGATTITQTQASGVSSYTVASAAGFQLLEYVFIGGANPEVVQISPTWNGASPLTFVSPTVNAHTSADPIYHSLRNHGYPGRSSIVVIDTGANDVPYMGPGAAPANLANTWQLGTFGTTPGASRGLTPTMHAIRFTIAQMRCTAIYKESHPGIVYGTGWNATLVSSAASWPPIYNFGGGALGEYHYTTTAGSTFTFVTEPTFPGGAVDVFTLAMKDGSGAVWDYSVSGATTVAMTSHASGSVYDTRNINATNTNDAAGLPNGAHTGSVMRITGLNAGVNTITVKATTIQTQATFLGIGIEAPTPPLIMLVQQYRLAGYAAGFGYGNWTVGYTRRTPTTTQTATVAANAGTGAGSVTLGTAVTVGTTAANTAAVYPGDTITIGVGTATEETRRITAINSTTTVTVDANFVNAHNSGAGNNQCIIGFQDADYVGGGWANTADTQGALSVPGLNGVLTALAAEFDTFVQLFNEDAVVNPPGRGSAGLGTANPNLSQDGVHMSDTGGGVVAYGVINELNALARPTLKDLSTYRVSNKRTFINTYNELYPAGQATYGGISQFVNGWQNYWPMSSFGVHKTGFYKDSRTRMVTLRGAITNYNGIREDQLPSAAFVIPAGFRPALLTPIVAWSTMGPALLEANSDGYVYVTAGFWTTAAIPTSGGAYLEFYANWLPEL